MSKKYLLLLIFVTLISVSVVSAADNATDDIVAADETQQDMLANETGTEIDEADVVYDDYEPKDYLYDNAVLKPTKLVTTYDSGKTFNVKAVSLFENNPPLAKLKLKIKVTTKSGNKYFEATTNSKGIAKFKVSKLPVGTYKVVVYSGVKETSAEKVTSTIKINKAKTKVSAPKLTSKYKKSAKFKIKIKNKATNKIVKNLKLSVKIGKNKYTLKTNSKGIASFNTKKLGVGKYTVTIKSKNSKYSVSAKSAIKIKW